VLLTIGHGKLNPPSDGFRLAGVFHVFSNALENYSSPAGALRLVPVNDTQDRSAERTEKLRKEEEV